MYKKEKHVLVIGGTGMLKKVSLWLANKGYYTSVIGRNRNRIINLTEINPLIVPVVVDYNDTESFKNEIQASIYSYGAFEKVIAWIHKNDHQIIDIISQEIVHVSGKSWELYHILGSNKNLDEIKQKITITKECNYFSIQLGFKLNSSCSRWLTHDEISDGIIKCIKTKQKVIIGQIEPWELRP